MLLPPLFCRRLRVTLAIARSPSLHRGRRRRPVWMGCHRTGRDRSERIIADVPRRHLYRRVYHRRDRDELRNARVALPRSLFRQRHLYLGGADFDGAGGAHRRLFPRRVHRRSHGIGIGPRNDRRVASRLSSGAAELCRCRYWDSFSTPWTTCGSAASTAALAITFRAGGTLGVYSPFAIRLMSCAPREHSGNVSGAVYSVSTAGSIARHAWHDVLPYSAIGTRAITLLLGAAGSCCGLFLFALDRRASAETKGVDRRLACRLRGARARRQSRLADNVSMKTCGRRCSSTATGALRIWKLSITISSSTSTDRCLG